MSGYFSEVDPIRPPRNIIKIALPVGTAVTAGGHGITCTPHTTGSAISRSSLSHFPTAFM